MPKIARLIIVSISLFLFAGGAAFAQETATNDFNFEKAYADYVYSLDLYQSTHGEYKLARAQYLQAQTLVAQTKARDATAKMLTARDDVMIAYLTAIRLKLGETVGVSEIERENAYLLIDSEVQWYKTHRNKISSAGTLDDLVDDSDEAKDQFSDFTGSVIYQALSSMPIAKVSVLRNDGVSLLTNIKSKVEEVKARGDWDSQIPTIERWVSETDNKITRSLDKTIETQASVPTTKVREGDYTNVLAKVQEAYQLLREATGFMREIVRNLRSSR
ncbi:hypothetical protein C4564_03725 [Candidatus Microgenomates bacterium]|nr:MAG: hypothetical protein C4564_03725 [Candidatus Microgenomates bacterium]